MSVASHTAPRSDARPAELPPRPDGKPADTPPALKPLAAKCWQTDAGLFQARHFVVIDPAIYPDVLTNAKHLTNVDSKISAFDRVEFRAADNTFVAEAIVAEVVQGKCVRMIETSKVILSNVPTGEPTATGEWQAIFLGGNRHWGVVHPNGTVSRDGLLTKAGADHEVAVRKSGSPLSSMSGR